MGTYIVYIKTDGYEEIGLGHLIRCLTIGDYLAECSDIEVRYIINSKSVKHFSERSSKQPYVLINADGSEQEASEIHTLLKKEVGSLLITDTYSASNAFYTLLRERMPTVPVVTIDDYGEKADFPVAGFINFNISADSSIYPIELRKYSAIGPEYFPLRRIICEEKKKSPFKNHKGIQRILVTMGGSDPEGQTVRIVALLKKINTVKNIDVLLGPAYDSLKSIEQCIHGDERFSLYHNPRNVAPLLAQADLAITGGGVTSIECIYLKVPVAVVLLAENQQPVGNFIEQKGCGMVLGQFDEISDEYLKTKLQQLIKNPQRQSVMYSACDQIVDGKGGLRLSEWIHAFLKDYHSNTYFLADVKAEYEKAAKNDEEYNKLKWGSPEGMMNRYVLAFESIQWNAGASWLDIGCGTGALLRETESKMNVLSYRGVDVSPSLIAYAQAQTYKIKNVGFICQDFMDDINQEPFDVVTAIGVLHKCGVSLRKAMARIAELVTSTGQVFLTTKNRDWNKFNDPAYIPYPGHHWFCLSEIKEACSLAGLDIIQMKGFEPRVQGQTCAPEEAHSIFIVARKRVQG